ncbi:hydroxyacid dehydrogenase, partial [Aduncisulcus paluster]
KGSYFINTSRGELVDHQALMDELDSGRIAAAAMDVFPDEFNPQFDITRQKMWKYINEHKNVIVTPHIAGSTEDAWRLTERKAIDMVCEGIKAGV